MSDLSVYELEGIIWDDYERSGVHIVPHPSKDHGSEDICEGDSCKKPRREVTPLRSNEGNLDASGGNCQVNNERDPQTLNKASNMMEEDSCGDADMPTLQSGDTKVLNHCFKSSNITSVRELCADEGILKDTSVAVDSNPYNYPGDIRQSDDLNLFSNDGDGKETSELLYYGWPDIGNFEDMDRMLSNCDSSFGLGIAGNDDELVWFTSEDPTGEYEEAMKVDLKFPCSEPSALTNISEDYEPRESEHKSSSFVSESKNEFKLKDQKEQLKQHNRAEVKKARQSLGNYGLKNNGIRLSSSEESDEVFTSIGNRQQNKSLGHDSFSGYMLSSDHLHPGHGHVPMQTTGGLVNGIKSENKNETSNASSQVQSMESSGDPLNKVRHAHTEGVKKGGSAELGLLDVPEGSSISSELQEISLEETSFRQLQQVMEQLDLRTKLCIRDSLYRLARSAEQRHNYAGINDSTTNCGGPLMVEGTNKCTGFMDIETDTNPIDRKIAHLLFHRPSDSSNMSTTPFPLKPNPKAHGPVANESNRQDFKLASKLTSD